MTKPFTATLVTTFAADGKLSLDQPANTYLGKSTIQGPNGDPEKVTVRLLGAHASGLPSTYQEVYGGAPSPAPAAFLSNYDSLAGLWKGTLMNDGVTLPVQLSIESSERATLAVGSHAPEKLSNMQCEGPAFLAQAAGTIDAPAALRLGASAIRVKVIPREGKLVGRMTAVSGPLASPLATLPFVVSLSRVP